MIDVDNAVIVDVEPTTAIRTAECTAAKRMLDRTEDRHGLYPERLIGDGGYGSGDMVGWLVEEKGIEPFVPIVEKGERDDGIFPRSAFTYDHSEDRYVCPAGKDLRLRHRAFAVEREPAPDDKGLFRYRATKADCGACPLKPQCCPKDVARKIQRHIYEGARDMARKIAKTEDYEQSRRDRKKVEMLFAHLKRILNMTRLRLRGPTGARDEFTLAAIAQNLRKLAKLVPAPTAAAA